jgi:diguanylate cyclase (GGDEF)-like protein
MSSDVREPAILTLAPDEIQRFLVRTRRDRDAERWEVRLDLQLRDILLRANDFVPSEAGAILLDDPRAKMGGSPNQLTFIACFGDAAASVLGTRVPVSAGIAGWVYSHGRPHMSDDAARDPAFHPQCDAIAGSEIRTVVCVPVIVGESMCGALELVNRKGGGAYAPRDLELLQIFAAYISSSMQNALDALRARELARRDDLTGLYNDRFFHRRLGEEMTRAEHDHAHLSLLFLDLDHFKQVNDRHGHLAGSRTLREVALLVRDHAPPGGIAARYGGDEFVFILPGADVRQAAEVAEAIRARVEQAKFIDAAGSDVAALDLTGITACLGVASLREHLAPGGTTAQRQNRLLRLADGAMYRGKAAGRNRVVIAEPEE